MSQDLTGKIVLVTGASSGIGEACARKFAARHARLVLAARRVDRLRQLVSRLGTDVHVLELDVRDRTAVNAAIAGLPHPWSEIDILVNNAGLSRGLDKLHEGDYRDWEEMIDTNVKGLLWVSRAVIPGMVARGRGHLINIGSIAGREVYPNGNVYCATKFAVDALTKGLRLDLVDTPIRVSTVDPGAVRTEFSEVRFHGDTERAAKVYQGFTPLSGDDVAEAVVWVADRPPHVTVADVLILPSAQASANLIHRE
ncbi:MAG TPA: SDR family oxidoreductase [candidate division Zixibacteria bacterium]|nr:SDR family oxidoreductase [candidate division Zixibacteria bacterium]